MRAAEDAAWQLRVEMISGQMALANRAGKSVCFLLLGADRGLQEVAAISAVDQLERDISALRDGDTQRALAVEQDMQTAAHLTSLDTVTRPFSISARQIVAGDLHRVPMQLFLNGVAPIGVEVDAVLQSAFGQQLPQDSAVSSILAVQQQGALVQGVLRDACLLRVGLLSAKAALEMRTAIAKFDSNMRALMEGDGQLGIAPAGTLEIQVTLRKVREYWGQIVPLIEATLDNEDVTLKQLQKASIHGDLLEKSLVKLRAYYWAL